MPAIDPDRYYCLADAAKLIPSSQGGNVCIGTLRNWIRAGHVQAQRRKLGAWSAWFIRGSELLRLLAPQPRIEVTPAQAKREHEKAMKELRKMGIGVAKPK